jgi:DNA-binding transcriptional regulator YhcF (GntR family)
MKNLGYIYLHRRLKENVFYKNPKYVSLWVHLLLSANHIATKILWNGEIVELKAGQFITGRKELSKQTGIKPTSVERILRMLESGHQIGQQKTKKFRIITITNWDKYQVCKTKVDIKTDNRRTTNGQQTDTNNNDNNDNNEKERVCLLLKNWNERQSSPISRFEPLNIINKHGVDKVNELIKSFGKKDGGFSLFLKALKK